MITRIEGCGSNDRHANHMKHQVKFTNNRVLTAIVEVLELENAYRYAVHNMWCFLLNYFPGRRSL